MGTKRRFKKTTYASNLNLKLLFFSLLSLSLFLLLLRLFISSFLLLNTPQDHINCLQLQDDVPEDQKDPNPSPASQSPPLPPSQLMLLVHEVLKDKEITNIGLVNFTEEEREEWDPLGETSLISFDPVKEEVRWEDLFPEWINEERWPLPRCPEIPIPPAAAFDGELDMVVSRVPCGSFEEKKGVRDVKRLQVNLVVANLVVRNGMRRDAATGGGGGGYRPVYAVFIGSCEPMWEIFRCDDLLRHEGELWIYKPELQKLKEKVEMPVGTCRLAIPYVKQGDGRIRYEFSKLGNPINRQKEAYVTMLHSSEAYVCGAIALAQSIILTKSAKDLVLLADKTITKKSKRALIAAGWKIKDIERIRSPYAKKDAYNEWNYSKLRMWQLTEYDKVIFIDSDLIVLKNMDNFFRNSQLSAVGNDNVFFNSGVMVIEPSQCMFEKLMKKRHTLASYNGGDQGFLNEAFTWWHRWPKTLNYLKIFNQANETEREIPKSVYAIHYLGLKPWMCYRDYDCNWDVLDHHLYASDLAHRRWWQVYDAIPKRLRGFCGLSSFMDSNLMMQRAWAKNAKLPDGHWKIKVKDPRRRHRSS
ncbi:putative UDP-glucuronate:xylan alpha-glucuronosyltransferase 5 [Macadamia integrifolia]|uniref:putative UDP-glucuronate:xylan alpha-glucuronosyltransferase 5 n=1 Tax=Macadamia integrifolia TaxID=60698 RepID=UPI001C4F1C11|nr:putative UDP-glucuronate:xylan alpha-glucuronosyltransferase 5 [Macadamia integrifolia]